jgi:type 1 glutamine amidotransferase
VWDHANKQCGHDAYGPFRVEITNGTHPITHGLASFETTDELYFGQQGDLPIEVLATARSKVTGRDQPMAFVYAYGDGRVFQTVLGHESASVRTPGAAELLRRGCVWAAGRLQRDSRGPLAR